MLLDPVMQRYGVASSLGSQRDGPILRHGVVFTTPPGYLQTSQTGRETHHMTLTTRFACQAGQVRVAAPQGHQCISARVLHCLP